MVAGGQGRAQARARIEVATGWQEWVWSECDCGWSIEVSAMGSTALLHNPLALRPRGLKTQRKCLPAAILTMPLCRPLLIMLHTVSR